MDGSVETLLSKRSKERIDETIRRLTPRNYGGRLSTCIAAMNAVLVGWIGFFGICTQRVESTLKDLDKHIRRRLRAVLVKQWKRRRTMVRNCIRRGVRPKTAWRGIYGARKGPWALSHTPVIDRALDNAYFAQSGLVTLQALWKERQRAIAAPAQLTLGLA